MGLWAKMKGVFSRIGSGIKKGFDWLRGNRDKIQQAAETAQQFVPQKYQEKFSQAIGKGNEILDRATSIYDRMRT